MTQTTVHSTIVTITHHSSNKASSTNRSQLSQQLAPCHGCQTRLTARYITSTVNALIQQSHSSGETKCSDNYITISQLG